MVSEGLKSSSIDPDLSLCRCVSLPKEVQPCHFQKYVMRCGGKLEVYVVVWWVKTRLLAELGSWQLHLRAANLKDKVICCSTYVDSSVQAAALVLCLNLSSPTWRATDKPKVLQEKPTWFTLKRK